LRIDYISDNIESALSTVNDVIQSRNEAPFNRQRSKMPNNLDVLSNFVESRARSISKSKSILGTDQIGVVLKGTLKIRLPSKALICSKGALSKKIRELNVVVQEKFFNVDVNRDNTPNLFWKFDEILHINNIKGVYFGKKKKLGNIKVTDIQEFDITITHLSHRRIQFLFDTEQEAFLWFKTLKSCYNKCNKSQSIMTPEIADEVAAEITPKLPEEIPAKITAKTPAKVATPIASKHKKQISSIHEFDDTDDDDFLD